MSARLPTPDGTLEERHSSLARAMTLHQEGRLDEAAAAYSTMLVSSPGDFDAMHMLGVISLQQGRFDAAQRLIGDAVAAKPEDVAALGNLGTSYIRGGQPGSALHWFEAALRLEPRSVPAMINVGTALHNLGRSREAIAVLTAAHAADPTSYVACNLLGASHLKCGEAHHAAIFFAAATNTHPENAEDWVNLSIALNDSGQHAEALDSALKARALDAESSAALAACAAAQSCLGRLDEAIASYRHCAASADPPANMLFAFGNTLLAAGLHADAIEQLRRAVGRDEGNLRTRWAIVLAHLQPVYADEHEMNVARRQFSSGLHEAAAWSLDSNTGDEPFNRVGVSQPFYLAYQPFNNRDLLKQYGDICSKWMTTLPAATHNAITPARLPAAVGSQQKKLRIGFASAHVHEHSVWNAITKGWIDNMDRGRFEIYLLQLDPRSDDETARIRHTVDHFECGPWDLPVWVDRIREMHLDALIYPEIGMNQLTLQLASLRLAPVQAAGWGHPETTGLPEMDLYFSADATEPLDADAYYSEKLIRLPHLGVHVMPLAPAVSKPGLRSLKLPTDEPLLLCPGAPFKYLPMYDHLWVRIARQLKRSFFRRSSGGRLVFFSSRSNTVDRMLESRLRLAFEKGDLDFDSHVKIIPLLDRSRFFGLMRESALMLDTPGFSGFNTAIQSIECDLPVLAYEGRFMRGRLASAIMRSLGLPEMVAGSDDEFVAKAVELAGNSGERRRIRAAIKKRRAALFGDLEPVRALERHLVKAIGRSSLG